MEDVEDLPESNDGTIQTKLTSFDGLQKTLSSYLS